MPDFSWLGDPQHLVYAIAGVIIATYILTGFLPRSETREATGNPPNPPPNPGTSGTIPVGQVAAVAVEQPGPVVPPGPQPVQLVLPPELTDTLAAVVEALRRISTPPPAQPVAPAPQRLEIAWPPELTDLLARLLAQPAAPQPLVRDIKFEWPPAVLALLERLVSQPVVPPAPTLSPELLAALTAIASRPVGPGMMPINTTVNVPAQSLQLALSPDLAALIGRLLSQPAAPPQTQTWLSPELLTALIAALGRVASQPSGGIHDNVYVYTTGQPDVVHSPASTQPAANSSGVHIGPNVRIGGVPTEGTDPDAAPSGVAKSAKVDGQPSGPSAPDGGKPLDSDQGTPFPPDEPDEECRPGAETIDRGGADTPQG